MNRIVDRFQGSDGIANLIDALLAQSLISGNRDLAQRVANSSQVLGVELGQVLINQDSDDNDLYFIISGCVGIFVNGQRVGSRGRGDHIGEMALIEPTQPRSATVIAEEPSIVAKVSAQFIGDVGTDYPEIYRHVAKALARRLRERNKLVGKHRDRTKVFIISSVESLPIARLIQSSFEHDPFLTTIWTDGVFRATSYALDALEAAIEDSDFAVAVAHSDDLSQFRGQEWPVPRDNVVFELGLFMGKLGRKRAILMEPREEKVKLPSDLSGVTTIPYRYEPGKDAAALLAPACNKLREHILQWGPFNG